MLSLIEMDSPKTLFENRHAIGKAISIREGRQLVLTQHTVNFGVEFLLDFGEAEEHGDKGGDHHRSGISPS